MTTRPSTTPTTAHPTTTRRPSAPRQQRATRGAQQLAGNFNTFLTLLTTQLQNQDPLDPLDTNQFTQQLVEFASVEQQVNMNTNLQTLISMQQTHRSDVGDAVPRQQCHRQRHSRGAVHANVAGNLVA